MSFSGLNLLHPKILPIEILLLQYYQSSTRRSSARSFLNLACSFLLLPHVGFAINLKSKFSLMMVDWGPNWKAS